MERKDYLKEELVNYEKGYIMKIIKNRRNKYISRDCKHLDYKYIDVYEHEFEIEDKQATTVVEAVAIKCASEIKSAVEFEKLISDKKLYNIVKALSLKQKMVLFYLFHSNKSEKEIVAEMKIHRSTLYRIRDKALTKIAKYIFGGESNEK